ncbi:hypothetical protein [Streptomyces sp. NPDC008001]|uniref:hypothetical protein n=1 Tax=Streptomyces sp. NPDC008001 TaxID=3364804 RepID=UPI0036E0CA6B
MTGRRGEKRAGRGKAVPRDMQDQQASATPARTPAGPPVDRAARRENGEGKRKRTDAKGGTGELPEQEPPD